MKDQPAPIDILIHDLKERAKELNCLYEVQELLNQPDITVGEISEGIVKAIPPGWQFPEVCVAKIIIQGETYQSPNFEETPWEQSADLVVQDEILGRLSVYYKEERPLADEGPFLKEERRLINTIAEQFGLYVLHQQLKEVFEEHQKSEMERTADWWVIINLLERTDPSLLMRISRRMINYLCLNGIKDAEILLEHFSPAYTIEGKTEMLDVNQPYHMDGVGDSPAISDEVFDLASRHLSEEVIFDCIQGWIREDQSGFLVNVLVNPSSSLSEISTAVERYHHLMTQGLELSPPRTNSVKISLIRRLLNDQTQFVDDAKKFFEVDDFNDLTQRMIYPINSHGSLGGKCSGLVLASKILEKSPAKEELLGSVKIPKTWYIASDNIFYFMGYNNLEDIVEQKYKDIGQVRQEYPYVIHIFKNSSLSPEIIKGLSHALDDFGDVPLIVRSSSLLEDRLGMSFAGKYKSLFIANRGTKDERLMALQDAIKEVYASMFGPDPIEYRSEHGLVDHHEEMGIMIQEVVGEKVGPYYFPVFAGVAFSNNEFPWSTRIKREDGLVRMVPGLGTRAVDRLSDDYPILISPGQAGLRVNVSLDEILRYSPKKIDVINLETGVFETIDIRSLLIEYGSEFPLINQLISLISQDQIRHPSGLKVDFDSQEFVITFEGLMSRTAFLVQIKAILDELHSKLNHPVDIEFACDGTDFYLLQCRMQSYAQDSQPGFIPEDVPMGSILFSANRHISNGFVSGITHIVYIDPVNYSELPGHQEMLDVGRAVGLLNTRLPKRNYILVGPGRWGSRGDIKLGVSVTYSDIYNTSMLIELARTQNGYQPDPSFGTHFFQDLIEASIRYLPLYPDDEGILFNENFFIDSNNILADLLPEYAHLSDVIRLIDVPESTNGRVLQVSMNAEAGKALGYLVEL